METSDFTLVCSYKNRLETLTNMLWSANSTFYLDTDFLLVDGGSDYDTLEGLRKSCGTMERNVRFLDCEPNSLWQAWNYGYLHCSTRYVIYASSDVVFHTAGFMEYIMSSLKVGYQYILLGNHAVFCIDRACLPKLGMWDEKFNNGPHADCDYMIRASEAGIKVDCGPNMWYNHGDTAEESKERLGEGLKDRLPMNDLHNERWFKKKWLSNWPGWEHAPDPTNLPHPPTSIGQVVRQYRESRSYPFLLDKLEKQYV